MIVRFFIGKEKPSLNQTISQQYLFSRTFLAKKQQRERLTSTYLMVCPLTVYQKQRLCNN